MDGDDLCAQEESPLFVAAANNWCCIHTDRYVVSIVNTLALPTISLRRIAYSTKQILCFVLFVCILYGRTSMFDHADVNTSLPFVICLELTHSNFQTASPMLFSALLALDM